MNPDRKLTYVSYAVGILSAVGALYVLRPLHWPPVWMVAAAVFVLYFCAGILESTMTACQPSVSNLGINLDSALFKTAALQLVVTLGGLYLVTSYSPFFIEFAGVGLLLLLAQIPSLVTHYYSSSYYRLQYPGAKSRRGAAGASIGVKVSHSAPPPAPPRYGQWFWRLPRFPKRSQGGSRGKATHSAPPKDSAIAEEWKRKGMID